MALTYAQLVTKIRNYTEVDSSVFTDDVVNGFIADAEERILRDVNTDADRRYATSTMITSQKFLNFHQYIIISFYYTFKFTYIFF